MNPQHIFVNTIVLILNSQVTQRNCILGRGDSATNANREILSHLARSTSKIPQLDGPIPDLYDDMLSTPNFIFFLESSSIALKIYNHQGVVNEDYNIVNTPASDVQAATPALVVQNDAAHDDDDEPLNENDDDDLDDVDQREELNTQHFVLAQFDMVTRTKSRWKCKLKDGIVHINNRDILFNKARQMENLSSNFVGDMPIYHQVAVSLIHSAMASSACIQPVLKLGHPHSYQPKKHPFLARCSFANPNPSPLSLSLAKVAIFSKPPSSFSCQKLRFTVGN
ncbi:hypothetical protein SLEP1_g41501 [Rubroshorea leprosula]|uniref:Uncharacterized protein n=1 Tax=Rubroshorea leprosula TaxID=152421 RepID=A0AAV5L6Q3_9ROSI|nr:hypothetical protein SLEP1_g41501 [Rubroshorea leprosula]